LPEYVKRLEAAAKPLGLLISFYGHAASGLVHVRPVVDLHRAEDIVKYRAIAETSAALAKELGASFSAEHGVGISHTELMEDQVGPEILGVMRGIKALFDPHNRMNPGKIFDDGRYLIDTNLRLGAGYRIELPFEPVLAYCKKDESFVNHLEQCNGCGDCRKDPDGMCPTFKVTGEEIMSTRGRANTIRAALDGRLGSNGGVLGLDALDEALSNCLACKNCQAECPSNVDLALMKAELLHARHQTEGVTLRDRVVSRVDVLGALGCMTPHLANWVMRAPMFRAALEKAIGFSAQRPLPPYAMQRFDRWFARHTPANVRVRGSVYVWDDCFVRYNEPNIGIAAVKVLEAAGYAVRLPGGRACCGRPAFSMGCLNTAKRFGERNVSLFRNLGDEDLILFLEPSCYTMFAQDYRELSIPAADRIAERCVLFERFMFDLLEREPDALKFRDAPMATAIHPHCHARALGVRDTMVKLAQRVPGNTASLLESAGCCGMAGAFGALKAKYDLSVAVAQPLVQNILALPPQTKVVASGTSCRHQIGHLTNARPLHMAELLALALDNGR
jgi:Fe-S oxidoreductase